MCESCLSQANSVLGLEEVVVVLHLDRQSNCRKNTRHMYSINHIVSTCLQCNETYSYVVERQPIGKLLFHDFCEATSQQYLQGCIFLSKVRII
uniref:LIM zinc-binding domain-containing protein n=1 Tax=Heterorhabditis bacteriophora TaxID=37862 RepID=A0A1I7X1C8_HETBA